MTLTMKISSPHSPLAKWVLIEQLKVRSTRKHGITYNNYSRTVFHLSALDFCPPGKHHSWMLLSMFLHRMPVPDYSEWLCPDPRTLGIRWWTFWFPPYGQRRSSHETPRPSGRRGAKTGRNRSAKILHRKTLVTFN